MSNSQRPHAGDADAPRLLHSELAQIARLAIVAEMASAMAHEINQPLTAIAAYSSALQRLIGTSAETVEQCREIAREIGEQALRAGNVVRRIRALVKHTEFDLQPADCNHTIEDLMLLAEPLARAHDIALGLELASGPTFVKADTLQLQLLLLNAIHNSIDAIESRHSTKRQITIGSRIVSAHEVEIFVADTGGGIEEAMRESLFRPFATTKAHGTGLGLLACQRIAHAHGGELKLHDQPGVGTRLSVHLPSTTAPAE